MPPFLFVSQIQIRRVVTFLINLPYEFEPLLFYFNRRGHEMKFIKKLFRNEAGATAIEYGLIAALIAVAAISAMQGLGTQLKTTFNTTSSSMAS